MLFSNLPLKEKPTAAAADSPPDEPNWLFIRTKQELDRLREQLQSAEKINQNSQKKIQSLEKEIARLKRQIIALEAIDQKIQEKKTTIPSAESSAQ
jgi:U3 small nucleolar ribonucleoprotein component